jgi:predicted nucleotidyltransferase
MRLAAEQKKFICDYWKEKSPSNQVYLFGSRVDDTQKGGDIDILVLTKKKLHHSEMFKMKQLFFSKFGEQKMDIVNFEKSQDTAFKRYILSYAKLLDDE